MVNKTKGDWLVWLIIACLIVSGLDAVAKTIRALILLWS